MKCFGRNNYGQLGYGDQTNRGGTTNQMGDYLSYVNLGVGLTAQSLHLGELHSCIHLKDDTIKCFGYADSGRLGYGDTVDRGDGSNEMGNYLPKINFGTNVEVSTCFDYSPTSTPTSHPTITYGPTLNPSITFSPSLFPSIYQAPTCQSQFSSNYHSCVLTSTQQIKCFGIGGTGSLGYGDTNDRGDGPNEMGNYLPYVNLDGDIGGVYIGGYFSCIQLHSTYQIKCWGDGGYGSLGYGDSSSRGDSGNEMGSYLPSINLGDGILASEIAPGYYHITIKDSGGQLKSWGSNDYGQLGYEDGNIRGDLPSQMGDYLPFINIGTGRSVVRVKSNYKSTCALLDNYDIKCYGFFLKMNNFFFSTLIFKFHRIE